VKLDIDKLEAQIRQDHYRTTQDFGADLEKLKQAYTQKNSNVTYLNKELVLKHITEKLILKAYDSISRREKE